MRFDILGYRIPLTETTKISQSKTHYVSTSIAAENNRDNVDNDENGSA